MTATRRSNKGQRLSDFFPSLDAASPISSSTPAPRRSGRNKATSTPAVIEKQQADTSTRSKKRKETPRFDPDAVEIVANDSEEDEFIKSLHFSPIKSATRVKSTPAAIKTRSRDFEVVVDYNSDSDGFTFSPVKFTPSSGGRNARKVNGTPAPVRRTKQVPQMVWNSAKKRVEAKISDTPASASRPSDKSVRIVTPVDHGNRRVFTHTPAARMTPAVRRQMTPKAPSDHDSETSSTSTEDSDPDSIHEDNEGSRSVIATYQVELDAVPARKITMPENTTLHSKSSPKVNMSTPIHSQDVSSRSRQSNTLVVEHAKCDAPSISDLPEDIQHNLQRTTSRSTISCSTGANPKAIPRNVKRTRRSSGTGNVTGSPMIQLTRAVSGAQSNIKLDKLAVPDALLSSEPDTLRKKNHQYQPFARIPKKLQATVPKPFGLSGPNGQAPESKSNSTSSAQSVSSGVGPQEAEHGLPALAESFLSETNRKRKAREEIGSLQSPAKRIKVDDLAAARRIAPLPTRNGILKPAATVPDFRFSSENLLKQRAEAREAKLRQQAEETEARQAASQREAGLVPRTLYSPEKGFRLNRDSSLSATKAAPFKFSTEARAAVRSPAVTPAAVASKKTSTTTTTTGRGGRGVAVLQTAPFIPRPSSVPATVPASPQRRLPSRLDSRRAFDTLAERHAEEVRTRRKRSDLERAAERERRQEERRGWRDSGLAAIASWASSKQTDVAASRGWQD